MSWRPIFESGATEWTPTFEGESTDFEGYFGSIVKILQGAASAEVVDGHLIITYTDGTVQDVGQVVGPEGDPGDPGPPGAAAGFGTPTATVDANIGTPSVEVSSSGPDTAKVFSFAFHNLAGNGIVSIAKTGTSGLVDTYTITYTNGDTDTFTVTNGQDGQGAGDMLKSTYDQDNDGVVDNAEALEGHAASYFAKASDLSDKQTKITASGILKGNGSGGVSAAVAGTDYQTPLVAGTDYATPNAIPSPASTTPAMDGTAAVGTSTNYARADHVHPTDTNIRQLPAVTSSDNGKVLRVVNGVWAAASLPSASGVSF